MQSKGFIGLIRDAFKAWGEDKASRLGAALSYYAIFSIGPLLVVVIAIAGFVFGEKAARGEIAGAVSGVVGEQGATMIQQMVQSANKPATGIIATIIGTVTLVLGAIGIFGQLKDALNTIWDVKPKPAKGLAGILSTLQRNLLSFGLVIVVAALLLLSLLVNTVLASLGSFVQDTLPGGTLLWQLVNYAVTLGVITLLFAVIYKALPDVHMPWNNVWIGAFVTAVLFVVGQIVLGFYFAFSDPGSAFGAAGSLVLVLVWIYYSALILFFGAEITQVYATQRAAEVAPRNGAMWVEGSQRHTAQEAAQPKGDGRRPSRAVQRVGERIKSPWFT